jgi:5-(carboxyamino)imidazole ribonucleotide synthase
VQTFPAVPILQRLSDRAHQKAILDDHAIPTAHWLAPKSTAQAEAAWQDRARHPHGLVRKVRLGGYDGYGTSVARRTIPKSKAAFTSTPEQLLKDVDASIFESLVPFDRELAITIGRTRHGRLFSFPWVETRQTQSRCLWVKGPVSPSRAMNRLENQLLKLLTSLGYIGVLTAEVFDVRGRLLVNELAPRVHNSCHHSLDSTLLDQFEAHLLCHFSDAKLRPPRRIQPSACFSMVNLLGRSPSRPGQEPGPPERLRFNGRLHWYGKAESRPGRKLGHITNLAPSLPKAIQLGIKDLKAYGWPLKREDEK